MFNALEFSYLGLVMNSFDVGVYGEWCRLGCLC